MSLTRDAAAEALHLIDEAGQRSTMLRGYQSAAPHLILWGGVYAIAYTFGYFRPHHAGVAWAALIPIATIGDVLIAWRDRTRVNWPVFLGLFATFLALIIATALVMQPHDPRQMAAFVPLVVAAAMSSWGSASAAASSSPASRLWRADHRRLLRPARHFYALDGGGRRRRAGTRRSLA